MNNNMILWLCLFLFFLIAEAATVALTSIWFAAGALLALIVSFFKLGILVEIVVFAISGILFTIFTKPILSKHLLKTREKTNYESVIGEKAKVTETINNVENKGTVVINGLEWSAKSENGVEYAVGDIVQVVKVEGVKVIVKK
ncbi:MAG: NfeD family protein [Lachnospiraceae bacterium]|nr:NfeD family protein [Lachnospiraceae bacterium]